MLSIQELEWGFTSMCETEETTGPREKLEWLLNKLELCRVQSTLLQFPIWDEAVPSLEESAEHGLMSEDSSLVTEINDNAINHKDIENDDGSDEDESKSLKNDIEPLDDEISLWPTCALKAKVWEGVGEDQRYSPAFVLQLLLEALRQYYAPLELFDTTLVENKKEVLWFLIVVQRICSNGGLALALASLSSACNGVRQLSAGCLFFITRAVNMKEGEEMMDWGSRRQLGLLLNSVQRGLCLRRKTQLTKKTDSQLDQTDKASIKVPLFSTVSALFLARASIILLNPSDPMYDSINSYFLNIRNHLGAFRDSGLRIPLFLKLFHGSIEGGTLSSITYKARETNLREVQRQRCWALRLLRDGLRDRFSVRAAFKSKIPSLLLGSLKFLYAEGSDEHHSLRDKEQTVTLEVLRLMVENGDRASVLYFHQQVGILPYLRIFLLGLLSSLSLKPSLNQKIALLKLISTSLQSILKIEHDERLDPVNYKELQILAWSFANPLTNLLVLILEAMNSSENQHMVEHAFETITCCIYDVCNLLLNVTHKEGVEEFMFGHLKIESLNILACLFRQQCLRQQLCGDDSKSLSCASLERGNSRGGQRSKQIQDMIHVVWSLALKHTKKSASTETEQNHITFFASSLDYQIKGIHFLEIMLFLVKHHMEHSQSQLHYYEKQSDYHSDVGDMEEILQLTEDKKVVQKENLFCQSTPIAHTDEIKILTFCRSLMRLGI